MAAQLWHRAAMVLVAALLAVAGLCSSALAAPAGTKLNWAEKYDRLQGGAQHRQVAPEFCVVVRTYWGHGARAGDGGLRRLLRSLQRQTVQS